MANSSLSSLTSATGSTASSMTGLTAKKTLDQEAFLQILVTELENQDPMQPLEDKEFITQLAQFSTLEQMQTLNQTGMAAQAFALVGRMITASPTDSSGDPVTGPVSRAFLKNGAAYLEVAGQTVPFSADLSVFLPGDTGNPTTSTEV